MLDEMIQALEIKDNALRNNAIADRPVGAITISKVKQKDAQTNLYEVVDSTGKVFYVPSDTNAQLTSQQIVDLVGEVLYAKPAHQKFTPRINVANQAETNPSPVLGDRGKDQGKIQGQIFEIPKVKSEPVGNIKYLYSVDRIDPEDSILKRFFYVGGHVEKSIFVFKKTITQASAYNTIGFDNLGGNRFLIELLETDPTVTFTTYQYITEKGVEYTLDIDSTFGVTNPTTQRTVNFIPYGWGFTYLGTQRTFFESFSLDGIVYENSRFDVIYSINKTIKISQLTVNSAAGLFHKNTFQNLYLSPTYREDIFNQGVNLELGGNIASGLAKYPVRSDSKNSICISFIIDEGNNPLPFDNTIVTQSFCKNSFVDTKKSFYDARKTFNSSSATNGNNIFPFDNIYDRSTKRYVDLINGTNTFTTFKPKFTPVLNLLPNLYTAEQITTLTFADEKVEVEFRDVLTTTVKSKKLINVFKPVIIEGDTNFLMYNASFQ